MHVAGFDLALLLRLRIGRGRPREFTVALIGALSSFISFVYGYFKPKKPATLEIVHVWANLFARGSFLSVVSEPGPGLEKPTFSAGC